jgi:peptide/nickel transport system permease protein
MSAGPAAVPAPPARLQSVTSTTTGARPRSIVGRMFARRSTLLGAVIVILIIGAAVLAPVVAPYDPSEQGTGPRLSPPSWSHLLGTDEFGRDVLSRLLFGAQVSLSVAAVAVLLLVLIGTLLGALAGFYGGWRDGMIMRVVDMLMSIPNFFLLIGIVALFGAGPLNTALVIGITGWTSTARLVRGQCLSLREKDFVEAARALGASDLRVLRRHVLPNAMGVIVVQATLLVSLAILLESGLSYLGMGAQPPTPSWGNMLSAGRAYMQQAWWLTTIPGITIFVAVLGFNLLGDGLRDLLDPTTRLD